MSWLGFGADLRRGESVAVDVSARALSRVAAVVFALPLAALLAGAELGRWMAELAGLEAELTSAVAGLACLALASTIIAGHGGALVGMLKIVARRQRTNS